MGSFKAHLKDQPEKEIPGDPGSGLETLKALGVKGLDRIVALKVNGENRDLSRPVEPDAELQPISLESEEGLEILRHSTSHVMAMAVKELFPGDPG